MMLQGIFIIEQGNKKQIYNVVFVVSQSKQKKKELFQCRLLRSFFFLYLSDRYTCMGIDLFRTLNYHLTVAHAKTDKWHIWSEMCVVDFFLVQSLSFIIIFYISCSCNFASIGHHHDFWSRIVLHLLNHFAWS